MLPVFLQHLPPPVGACGERNYALFFAASGMMPDCTNCDNTSELAFFSIKSGPVSQLVKSGE